MIVIRHLGDITKINGAEIDPVDIITGGSPCQDLSVAGKRAGLEGERSGLFMEQIRVIKEMREADVLRGRTGQSIRCRYAVWENVPGCFSSNGGRDFQSVLTEFIRVADPDAPSVPLPSKGKWRKWANSTDLANKTSVTVGGEHQKIFDADTKVSKGTGTYKLYGRDANGNETTISWAFTPQSGKIPCWAYVDKNHPAILSASDPVASIHVATKNYVDTQSFSLDKGIEKTDLNFTWDSTNKTWDYNPIGNYYGEDGGSIEILNFYVSGMSTSETVSIHNWKLIGVENSDDSCL